MRFGEKGLDMAWDAKKEQRELEQQLEKDFARVEAEGDTMSLPELVDIWERSWEELRIRIGLGWASRAEIRVRSFKADRIRQRARELLRRVNPERYAELMAEEAEEERQWPSNQPARRG
jgi:hypothetical protein